MRRRLALAVALPAILFVAACNQREAAPAGETTVADIQRKGTLDVCYVVYAPTVFKEPNTGAVRGHFIDAIAFIARTINVNLRYHETQFGTFTAALSARQCDVAVAATYRTIPRAAQVAFTTPIIYLGNGAIVRSGEQRFRRPEDFNRPGVRLAVAQGEASHEYATQHFPRAQLIVLATSDLSLPLAEVLAGRADAGLADAYTTAQFARQHPGVTDLFPERPYDLTPVGWAVRPQDQQLLRFLDTSIDYLTSTGRMDEWERNHGAHWLRPVLSVRTGGERPEVRFPMGGYSWDVGLVWLYRDAFLLGARVTIELTAICIVVGMLLGVGMAGLRMSTFRPLRWLTIGAIEILRAIPLLVLLVWLYFCLPILSGVSISGYAAAAIGLSLNLAPFAAETFRAGIEAVPTGVGDAARSLGMSQAQAFRHIVLPQAFRQMLPPFVGLWITMLKLTSLASVIAVPELLHKSSEIISVTFHPLEIYTGVAVIYMMIVIPLSWIAQRFESSRLLNHAPAIER